MVNVGEANECRSSSMDTNLLYPYGTLTSFICCCCCCCYALSAKRQLITVHARYSHASIHPMMPAGVFTSVRQPGCIAARNADYPPVPCTLLTICCRLWASRQQSSAEVMRKQFQSLTMRDDRCTSRQLSASMAQHNEVIKCKRI